MTKPEYITPKLAQDVIETLNKVARELPMPLATECWKTADRLQWAMCGMREEESDALDARTTR